MARQTRTLSGGEAQRITLANQLGAKLVGTLYVLDEPTIGLHARDTSLLATIMRELADAGNTVVVVEHDLQIMRAADHVVELGPFSGERGGTVVASAPRHTFLNHRSRLPRATFGGTKGFRCPRLAVEAMGNPCCWQARANTT